MALWLGCRFLLRSAQYLTALRYQIIRANHRPYFIPAVCQALCSRSLETIYASHIEQVKGCHKVSLVAK